MPCLPDRCDVFGINIASFICSTSYAVLHFFTEHAKGTLDRGGYQLQIGGHSH